MGVLYVSVLEQQFSGSLTPPALTAGSRNKGTWRAEVMWEGLWHSLLCQSREPFSGETRGELEEKASSSPSAGSLGALAGRTEAEGTEAGGARSACRQVGNLSQARDPAT